MRSDMERLTRGVRWVWFDLDDTLIDFHTNSRAALRLLYEEEGLDRFYPTAGEWIEAYENHNRTLWDRYSRGEITQEFLRVDRFAFPLSAGREDVGRDEPERYSRRLDPLYLDLLAAQKTLVDGAEDILDFLRGRKYNIGVLSNGFTDVQNKKLRNTGLDRKVDLMVLSDDIGVNKPDVRLYRHAMMRSGEMEAGRHLMIGDNPSTDIAGAVNAGWGSILLERGSEEAEMAGDTLVIPSLRSLFALKW